MTLSGFHLANGMLNCRNRQRAIRRQVRRTQKRRQRARIQRHLLDFYIIGGDYHIRYERALQRCFNGINQQRFAPEGADIFARHFFGLPARWHHTQD